MTKAGLCLLCIALGTLGLAQTPPIRPNTPDITTPPPLKLPPPPNPEAIGAAPLSADEAVAVALRLQPNVIIARSAIEAAAGRTRQAQSGLLPQFGLNAGITNSGQITGSRSGGSSTGTTGGSTGGSTGGGGGTVSAGFGIRTNAAVSVSQLLFDFGRTRDQVREDAALQRAATHEYTATQEDTALAVRQAYYNYGEALAQVTVSESNLANRQAQLDLANARLGAGVGAPGDVVQAKTALAAAVDALVTARAAAELDRVSLAQAIGIDPRTPLTLTAATEPEVNTADPNGLVKSALSQRPAVLAARERVNAAQYGVSAASKTNYPSLSLSGSLSARGSNNPLDSESTSVGVTLSWPFGDGGLGAGRVQEARAGLVTAQAQLTQATQQVVAEVAQSYLNLVSADQRLVAAQQGLANAVEYLRIAEGRYRGGIGAFLDVTTAQAALFSAQQTLARSTADVQRSRAALRHAIGQGATLTP